MTCPRLRQLLIVALFLTVSASTSLSQTLTLRQAISLAETNSPIAITARERIAEASAKTRQAEALFYPMLRLTSSYSQSNNPVNVFMYSLNQGQFELTPDLNNPNAADNWLVSAQAGIRLFNGGRDWYNRRASVAAEAGMRSAQAATLNELTMQVIKSYLLLQTSAEFVHSAETSVSAYTKNEAVMADRVGAGTVLKTELLNIQVQKAQAEERLLQAQNAKELATEGLRLAIGLEDMPFSEFETLDQISFSEPSMSSPGERPEISTLASFTEAARAGLRAAKGGYLPSLGAFASIDRYQGWEYDGHKQSWTAGLSLEWNLFDGFLTASTVNEKRAALNAAKAAERQARLQTSLELKSAIANLAEAKARVGVMERAVGLAHESSELTRQRFEQGLALSSHVIDAEDAVVQAELGLTQAKSDRLVALAALRRALALPIIGDPQ